MIRPPERHTPFYELWDALDVPDECAICRLCRQRAQSHVASLFYENVNDPGVRQRLHASLGFGAEGTKLAEELHDALGLSILYGALADDVRQRLARPSPELLPTAACPVEEAMRETEARYLAEIARHYAADDLQTRHAAGFGFCVGHLRAALRALGDKALRLRLAAAEAEKFALLAAELKLFERRSGYDNREPFGHEGDAWRRALRKFRRPEPGAPA